MQSLALFLIGALLGINLITRILSNRPTSKAVVFFHTLFVVAGMALLFMLRSANPHPYLNTSLALLGVAALGGVAMVYMDVVKKLKPPAPLAIAHMLLAVSGVIFLVLYLVQK